MRSASRSARFADLELECRCSPDPIDPTGATHDVELHNDGYDRLINTQLAVVVYKPGPGCSIAIPPASGVVGMSPLPSGRRDWRAVVVDRVPGGWSRNETINTVVSFSSDAEDEALDDSMPTPVHTCECKLDVGIR